MSKSHAIHQLKPTVGGSVHDMMTALIREAHKQRGGLVEKAATIAPRGSGVKFAGGGSPMLPESLRSLLHETEPTRRLSELVLAKQTVADLRDLIDEVRQTPLLRSHSLEPRHTLMLVGPPGTGKTSLAAALATELALPFLTVRYEGLVGSFLGETASRLQEVIDYASRTPCVLFFDEFDSVGKERSDSQETGEIKRVVSSLLLHMDALPTHCIVVCATNHPELLDRAVWRRFELRIELPRPGATELRDWFSRTERSFGNLGMTSHEFVTLFSGETFSEIEAVTIDARRKHVLSQGKLAPSEAFRGAVERWERRRSVGNYFTDGSATNRKNSTRTRASNKETGRKAKHTPQGDLLGGTGDPT
jgi:ATP-dependent 26S proteasome regulatory subunit